MKQPRSFRFALPTTLVAAVAVMSAVLPASAEKQIGGNDCDDSDSGIMTVDGKLTVSGTSRLSACATRTDFKGTVTCTFQSDGAKLPGKPKPGEITLTKTSIQTTTANGQTSTASVVSGTLILLDCTADGACKDGPSLDVTATLSSDGNLVGIWASKKGYDYYKAQSQLAALSGGMTSNEKEGTVSVKGTYIGHVTIVK